MIPHNIARTLSIVGEMANGKFLTLSDGHRIGMGEDMSIGFILTHSNGNETVGGLCDMTLRELDVLLEREGLGMAIPSMKR